MNDLEQAIVNQNQDAAKSSIFGDRPVPAASAKEMTLAQIRELVLTQGISADDLKDMQMNMQEAAENPVIQPQHILGAENVPGAGGSMVAKAGENALRDMSITDLEKRLATLENRVNNMSEGAHNGRF